MSILIDTKEQTFVLTGQVDIFNKNPRLKRRLEANTLKTTFEDERVLIFFSNDDDSPIPDYENQYLAITNTLNRNNVKYEITENTKNLVELIELENKNFSSFSRKAYEVRNGDVPKEEYSEFVRIIENKLPGRKLYPLQERSAYHLAFSQNSCNFSVPGAGKTTVVYAAYSFLKNLRSDNEKFVDKVMVISPLSAFKPWIDEYEECFQKKPLSKKILDMSPSDKKKFFLSDKKTELILISYQSVASNEENVTYIIDYLKNNKVMVVLDEAHRIKRSEGVWAEAVLSLSKFCKSRVVLTGTPIPRGYHDIINIYKFIWPTKDIVGFPLNYLQRMTESNYASIQNDIERLTNNIAPFFIRVKKSDLNLAKKIEHPPILVEMTPSQRIVHDYLFEDFMHDLDEKSSTVKRLITGRQVRLRQSATNPALLREALDKYDYEYAVAEDTFIDDREIEHHVDMCSGDDFIPPKFEKVLELINQITKKNGADGKVIIWSVFISNILRLQKYLTLNSIPSEVLYGGIESDNRNFDSLPEITQAHVTREQIIKDFHTKDTLKVIIANPIVVGESVSLHKACHNAIYLEKDYNAATYMQSKDRIHRVDDNTDYTVNYYHLISERSIDDLIHQKVVQRERKQLEIIEKYEIPLFTKSLDELLTKDMLKEYYARTIKSGN